MNKKSRLIRILITAGIVILVLLCAVIYELYRSSSVLTVNTYEYETDKINEPIKIVIIGDLHNHSFGNRLKDKIAEQEPDLIIMAGDMIDYEKADEEQVYALVSELKEYAPVIYSLGNHEMNYIKQHAAYTDQITEACGIVLDQEYMDISIKEQRIRIGGLYAYPFGLRDNNAETAPEDIQSFMQDFCDTDDMKLFIAHRPDSFVFGNVSKVYDIDLVVSSHLHGGQVVVPFKGGLYGGDQGWFPRYVHGMYEKDKIHLLITSGLGSSDQKLPRFLNPPEIMVLELK